MFGGSDGQSIGHSFLSLTEPEEDAAVVLEPLIRQIRYYDELRLKLEKLGGKLLDLEKISQALSKRVLLKGRFGGPADAALVDPNSVRALLFEAGNFDLHMEVRQLDTGMPAYYLCRIRRDFWCDYTLIVEDLYRSPGYPVIDDRFVKLMSGGHETYHLRLSQFRNGVTKMLMREGEDSQRKVDEVLFGLGRNVFQAAWHEDQRPAFVAATHFHLQNFKNAIELLYVCLTGELCELRGVINDSVVHFFDEIYPQPALRSFLRLLTLLEGGSLNELPQKALRLYSRLSKAFSGFLRMEVVWGSRRIRVPLYKLIFGNFTRLNRVGAVLAESELMTRTIGQLEAEAQFVIDEIVKDQK